MGGDGCLLRGSPLETCLSGPLCLARLPWGGMGGRVFPRRDQYMAEGGGSLLWGGQPCLSVGAEAGDGVGMAVGAEDGQVEAQLQPLSWLGPDRSISTSFACISAPGT